jgi:hypothetical protein
MPEVWAGMVVVDMKCPKCGSECETDDDAHYQCTNLGCINAWCPFTFDESKLEGEKVGERK